MIKLSISFIIIALLVFIQASRNEKVIAVNICETTSEVRKCPKNKEKLFLPRSYSARAIYVGYSTEKIQLDFLKSLISEIAKLKVAPKLNILIPRSEQYYAHEDLKGYFNSPEFKFINIIPTSSKETIWAQDYLEILLNTKTGQSEIVDLPYLDREGDDLPASIALYCQKNLIPQAEFNGKFQPSNGDYGGNIEPFTTEILTVGSNISNETLTVLSAKTSQEIVEINVDWLETGHVDELITTLPHRKNAQPCEQSLLIASPQKALDVISTATHNLKEEKNPNKVFQVNNLKWRDHFHCLYVKNTNKLDCQELKRANRIYQELINISVKNLQKVIESKHGCRLAEEQFPQLFVPVEKRKKYGQWDDRAVALNPNSVNNIFFFPNLLLAKQRFAPFQSVVDKILDKFPYKRIYMDDKFAHELNGGIHCATNISYSCTP